MSRTEIELVDDHPGDPELVGRACHRCVAETIGDVKVLRSEFWRQRERGVRFVVSLTGCSGWAFEVRTACLGCRTH
jgi:hypothetical protein